MQASVDAARRCIAAGTERPRARRFSAAGAGRTWDGARMRMPGSQDQGTTGSPQRSVRFEGGGGEIQRGPSALDPAVQVEGQAPIRALAQRVGGGLQQLRRGGHEADRATICWPV